MCKGYGKSTSTTLRILCVSKDSQTLREVRKDDFEDVQSEESQGGMVGFGEGQTTRESGPRLG